MKALAIICFMLLCASECLCDPATDPLLNIFLIPHSHNDAGYKFSYKLSYEYTVRLILEEVTRELAKDSSRRFNWDLASYLYTWLHDDSVNPQIKEQFLDQVRRKQIEIVGGGWVMQDEAVSMISQQISQMTMGLRYYQSLQSPPVTKGWQIDPFGSSSSVATEFSLMGMDAAVYGRYPDWAKKRLIEEGSLEFNWVSSRDLNTTIFAHFLCCGYHTPKGFDFENPLVPPVSSKNIKALSDKLVDLAKKRAKNFKTPNVLIPLGTDAAYILASREFDNIDKLISYINAESSYGVKIQYGTLTEYFSAVKSHTNVQFPTFVETDFFPYGGNKPQTGFYTTNPSLKRNITSSFAALHTADVFSAQAVLQTPSLGLPSVFQSRFWTSIGLHHDALPGTCYDLVAWSYKHELGLATPNVVGSLADSANSLGAAGNQRPSHTVFNPLGFAVTRLITLNVTNDDVSVIDSLGAAVVSQVQPVVFRIHQHDDDPPYTVSFVTTIPALGFKSFQLVFNSSKFPSAHHGTVSRDQSISNGRISVAVDDNGLLSAVGETKMTQGFKTYQPNPDEDCYVFLPVNDGRVVSPRANFTTVKGPVFSAIYQEFPEQQQVLRVIHTNDTLLSSVVEVEMFFGPLIQPLLTNQDLVTEFNTSLVSGDDFFTDMNSLVMKKRTALKNESLSQNYRPMSCCASIQGAEKEMMLISGVPHGATSVKSGAIQVMIHRRITTENSFLRGDDISRLTETFWLMLDSRQAISQRWPVASLQHHLPPVVLPTGITSDFDPKVQLPPQVHLQEFRKTDETGVFIVRVHHMYSKFHHADEALAVPVTFSLKDALFPNLQTLVMLNETNLALNVLLNAAPSPVITLNPLQYRNFFLKLH